MKRGDLIGMVLFYRGLWHIILVPWFCRLRERCKAFAKRLHWYKSCKRTNVVLVEAATVILVAVLLFKCIVTSPEISEFLPEMLTWVADLFSTAPTE